MHRLGELRALVDGDNEVRLSISQLDADGEVILDESRVPLCTSQLYTFEFQAALDCAYTSPLTRTWRRAAFAALAPDACGTVALFGPAGMGKTAAVEDLGVELGRGTIVTPCTSQTNAAYFASDGEFAMLMNSQLPGTFYCFDEFNRTSETAAALAGLVALRNRLESFGDGCESLVALSVHSGVDRQGRSVSCDASAYGLVEVRSLHPSRPLPSPPLSCPLPHWPPPSSRAAPPIPSTRPSLSL